MILYIDPEVLTSEAGRVGDYLGRDGDIEGVFSTLGSAYFGLRGVELTVTYLVGGRDIPGGRLVRAEIMCPY